MAIQIPNPGTGNGATGDNEFVLWSKVKDNFSNATHAANKIVGVGSGQIPLAQDVASAVTTLNPTQVEGEDFAAPIKVGRIFSASKSASTNWIPLGVSDAWALFSSYRVIPATIGTFRVQQAITERANLYMRGGSAALATPWLMFYSTGNTTKDSNGFIKAASPVVDLYDDYIELNNDAEKQGGITYKKLGTGDYIVKGSLGFAQEGWYIEMPKDANGNVLVAVVYEQLENNDISIKTYDYMLNNKGRIVPDTETPLDIPEGRCINLRLHEEQIDEPIE